MLDNLQMIFWSLTYVIIIYNGIRYRQERPILMPLLPGCLNLAWEINAIITSKGLWGHILWLTLDIVIFALNTYNLRQQKSRALYCLLTATNTAAFGLIFRLPNVAGMLISSFVIDFIMAFEYLRTAKNISGRGKAGIALTKLIGDCFAWLFYMNLTDFVGVIGIAVLLMNLYYLSYCLKEKNRDRKRKRKQKRLHNKN